MKNLSTLLVFFLLAFFGRLHIVKAQCISPFNNCADANCVFDTATLNNTLWTMEGFDLTFPIPAGFCGTLETPHYYPFISDGAPLDLTVTPAWCANNQGLQVAIVEGDCGTVVDCGAQNAGANIDPFSMSIGNLLDGHLYYILVDGFAADSCDYYLHVTSGIAQTTTNGLRRILASAHFDTNSDCLLDAADLPAQGLRIGKSAPWASTSSLDANGQTGFIHPLDENALLTMDNLALEPSVWSLCEDSIFIPLSLTGINDTVEAHFLLQANTLCADLHVDLGTGPVLSQTAPNLFSAQVQNYGSEPAQNATLRVIFPGAISYTYSGALSDTLIGDSLFFDLGTLPPLQSTTVLFSAMFLPPYAQVPMGTTACVEATVSTTSAPCTAPPANQADVRLTSACQGDTLVVFTLENIGTAPTGTGFEYIIIEDEVVLRQEDFNLNVGQSMDVMEMTTGQTWRMEADRNGLGSKVAAFFEGCGGLTPNLVNAFWLHTAFSDSDLECRTIGIPDTNNLRIASPSGVGAAHIVPHNTPIQYSIIFQNNSPDTLHTVVLEEHLPSALFDQNSFQPGASTFPYHWEMMDGVVKIRFDNLTIPNHATNPAAATGFFNYTILPNSSLPSGTVLETKSNVHFNQLTVSRTNSVLLTIGNYMTAFVSSKPEFEQFDWQVLGNPIHTSCTFISEKTKEDAKQFLLFDAQGRQVHQRSFSGKRLVFEANTLQSGLYFFKIRSAAGVESSGKLIVE